MGNCCFSMMDADIYNIRHQASAILTSLSQSLNASHCQLLDAWLAHDGDSLLVLSGATAYCWMATPEALSHTPLSQTFLLVSKRCGRNAHQWGSWVSALRRRCAIRMLCNLYAVQSVCCAYVVLQRCGRNAHQWGSRVSALRRRCAICMHNR